MVTTGLIEFHKDNPMSFLRLEIVQNAPCNTTETAIMPVTLDNLVKNTLEYFNPKLLNIIIKRYNINHLKNNQHDIKVVKNNITKK